MASKIAYQEGLIQDISKEYRRRIDSVIITRDDERWAIQVPLRSKVPDAVKELVDADDQRLLRLNSRLLSPQERARVQEIKSMIKARYSRCFNLSDLLEDEYERVGRLFRLTIPDTPFVFCFDVLKPLSMGTVDKYLWLVDVMLSLPDGERYAYPLSQDEAELYFWTLASLGVDVYNKQTKYPEIEILGQRLTDAKNKLSELTSQ